MNRVLEGLEGAVCLIDDVLVYRTNQKVHDSRLKAVLEQMERAGITLNTEKCSFNHKFLGHMLTSRKSQQTQRRQLLCVR